MTGPAHSTARAGGRDGDRAVSDLIAFVLMFAIIITGVGLVSFGAFDNLSEFSDREQIESGERGLSAAAATIDDIHRQSDTRRSFSLALGGGSVYLNESFVSLNLSSSDTFNSTFHRQPINATEHRFDRSPEDVTVFYEGGGVFRSPGFGARYEPSLQCKDGTAIVSLVRLEAENFAISRGGGSSVVLNPRGLPGESPVADLDDTLLFSAELVDQNRTYRTFDSTGASPNLVVNFTGSPDPEQWENYFEQSDGWESLSSGEGVCKELDTVLVRVTTVELSL